MHSNKEPEFYSLRPITTSPLAPNQGIPCFDLCVSQNKYSILLTLKGTYFSSLFFSTSFLVISQFIFTGDTKYTMLVRNSAYTVIEK